ncbi:MAG: PP2C family protein-serine/threonine phosphatase [Pseudomonadota bacterium]
MSLLVLDPEIANAATSYGARLQRQLTELGYITLDTADPGMAIEMSSQGNVEVVICCDLTMLTMLSGMRASVGLVLGTAEPLNADQLITALRGRVQDVWQGAMDNTDLTTRADDMLNRRRTLLDDLNLEVASLRSELEKDQRAGQHIQMGMLPPNPMGIGHFRLQHRVEPSLMLSGDFVDYFQISERYFACYVADVAGHGASSAFVTVLLKNFSRRLRREYRHSMLEHPGEVLAWFNSELLDQGIDKHVAMFFAIVDTVENQLHYANAAHLPPAALVVGETITNLEQKAKPLGLFPDVEFLSRSIAFPEGAKLVVFSDGVLDLIPRATLADKESFLSETIGNAENMDALWADLKLDAMGPDDVSCLMVQHQ